jgi:hypothetical protein
MFWIVSLVNCLNTTVTSDYHESTYSLEVTFRKDEYCCHCFFFLTELHLGMCWKVTVVVVVVPWKWTEFVQNSHLITKNVCTYFFVQYIYKSTNNLSLVDLKVQFNLILHACCLSLSHTHLPKILAHSGSQVKWELVGRPKCLLCLALLLV